MSQSHPDPMITRKADASFSGKTYLFVKFTASNGCAISGAGEACNGILQNGEAASGKEAAIAIGGTSKLTVDGNASAISIGDSLKSDALGKGVVTTTDNELIGAIAMEPSTAAGDIIEVQVTENQRY